MAYKHACIECGETFMDDSIDARLCPTCSKMQADIKADPKTQEYLKGVEADTKAEMKAEAKKSKGGGK